MGEKESVLSDFDVGNKDYKPPSVEELLAALENIALPEKEKEELRKSILSGELAQKAESIAGAATQKVVASSGEFVVLFLLISLVFLVLVFFGYKLYSSLKEKERKREEKRKLKQQKKKK
ncbi:unnamed protein product [Phyllotreta striolata]|uniref:Uncharacterized protein n=1 Tax=Phyllotreta striolata TaxID=444603 RepID=A0A9N9TJU9_PHYSR|nr:unnamed protein product [Phyllotreta striolata]